MLLFRSGVYDVVAAALAGILSVIVVVVAVTGAILRRFIVTNHCCRFEQAVRPVAAAADEVD